jgi:hypothetical protein
MRVMGRCGRTLTGSVLAALALATGTQGASGAPATWTASAGNAVTTARGVVKAVSATQLALETAEAGKRAEVVLVLNDRTIVMKGRRVLTVKDVHRGDPVTIAWAEENGHRVAKRVWLRAADADAGTRSGKR